MALPKRAVWTARNAKPQYRLMAIRARLCVLGCHFVSDAQTLEIRFDLLFGAPGVLFELKFQSTLLLSDSFLAPFHVFFSMQV